VVKPDRQKGMHFAHQKVFLKQKDTL